MRKKPPLKRKLLSNFRDICYEFLIEVCKAYYSAQQCAINISRTLHVWSSLTSHTREPFLNSEPGQTGSLGVVTSEYMACNSTSKCIFPVLKIQRVLQNIISSSMS